ncbi:hypothetical protein G7046_g2026 [Stylonectria norvegica]|nr:hypothetical protein G7046_g2026 [Stylonectria norvegica]
MRPNSDTNSLGEQNKAHNLTPEIFKRPWIVQLGNQITNELRQNAQWIGIMSSQATTDGHGTKMLDYACGNGVASRALAPLVDTVRGMDISTGMVKQYNEMAAKDGLSAEKMRAIPGDLVHPETTPSPEFNSLEFFGFDVIVMCMALHHVEDYTLMIKKLSERLSAGGVLVIIDWVATSESGCPGEGKAKELSNHTITRMGFKEQDVKRAYETAGLEGSHHTGPLNQTQFNSPSPQLFSASLNSHSPQLFNASLNSHSPQLFNASLNSHSDQNYHAFSSHSCLSQTTLPWIATLSSQPVHVGRAVLIRLRVRRAMVVKATPCPSSAGMSFAKHALTPAWGNERGVKTCSRGARGFREAKSDSSRSKGEANVRVAFTSRCCFVNSSALQCRLQECLVSQACGLDLRTGDLRKQTGKWRLIGFGLHGNDSAVVAVEVVNFLAFEKIFRDSPLHTARPQLYRSIAVEQGVTSQDGGGLFDVEAGELEFEEPAHIEILTSTVVTEGLVGLVVFELWKVVGVLLMWLEDLWLDGCEYLKAAAANITVHY